MDKHYNIKRTELCRNCYGEGFVVKPGEHLGHGRYSDPKEDVCTLCNGTGIVVIQKEIHVTITPKYQKLNNK